MNNNYKYLSTGEPTYWPTYRNNIPDLLDFCITKGISQEYPRATSCFDLSSDQSVVLSLINTELLERETPHTLSNKYIDGAIS